MRIRTIHIDQFGAWRNQDVPLVPRGLNVLYGPNEAGKSTVMRCVRRLLFGFRPEDETGPGPRPRRVACAGSLDFTDARGEYVLRREGGNPFTDPTLDEMVGKRVRFKGLVHGYTLIFSDCKPIEPQS